MFNQANASSVGSLTGQYVSDSSKIAEQFCGSGTQIINHNASGITNAGRIHETKIVYDRESDIMQMQSANVVDDGESADDNDGTVMSSRGFSTSKSVGTIDNTQKTSSSSKSSSSSCAEMQFSSDKKPLILDRLGQKQLREYMPKDNCITHMSELFGVLGDYTRIKIISALSITAMCVTDISTMLELNQTTVSHQLRMLKSIGAVNAHRHGKIIFYELATEKLNDVMLAGVEYLGYA